MKAAFRLTLALIATFGASGCRTAGLSPSARPTPAVVPEPKLSFHLDEFIEDHNRNAEQIESLKAKASITATMDTTEAGDPKKGVVSGRLSLLRPKSFKLDLFRYNTSIADIGSNDDRFWFWLQSENKDDRHVYYCDYSDLPTTNLAGTYQPDWIVDALGLKPITADEAASIRVAPGPVAETTKLTFPASSEGSSYQRVMIVSDRSKRLVGYRVFDRDGKTLIGEATINRYSNVDLKNDDVSTEPRTCYVVENVKLEWKREKLALEILLTDIDLNEPFSQKMQASLFVEPTHKGYTPLDLAEATRNMPRTGGEMTAVRETLPAPERSQDLDRGWGRDRSRAGPAVEIEGAEPTLEPESRRASTPASPRSIPPKRPARPKPDDEAPSAALAPILLPVHDDVVGAVRPQAPGTPYQAADSSQLLGGGTFAR